MLWRGPRSVLDLLLACAAILLTPAPSILAAKSFTIILSWRRVESWRLHKWHIACALKESQEEAGQMNKDPNDVLLIWKQELKAWKSQNTADIFLYEPVPTWWSATNRI